MNRPAPDARGAGSGAALLIGTLSFFAVLALILGGALGARAVLAGGSADPAPAPSPASPAAPTSPIAPEDCWYPEDAGRIDQGSSAYLASGGISLVAPGTWEGRESVIDMPFVADATVAYHEVEPSWVSSITVGALERGPEGSARAAEDVEARTAAQEVFDCVIASPTAWEGTENRRLEGSAGDAVTLGGMEGYRVSGDLLFDSGTLQTVSGSHIVVVVLESPSGLAVVIAETAIGHPEDEEAAERALSSIGPEA